MPTSDHTVPDPSNGQEDWLAALSAVTGTSVEERDANISKTVIGGMAEGESLSLNKWEVGAYIDSGENEEINNYARAEISSGAEALLFRLYHQPDAGEIAQILEGIDIGKQSLHCTLRYPGQDPAELFRDLVRFLRREGHQLKNIAGSVDFDPLLDWSEPPFPPLIRLLYFVSRWMPRFRVLQVNAAGFNNGVRDADIELALAISKGASYLKQIEKLGYPAALANNHLQFAFTVGYSFYGDIAKLRALRVLWDRVLESIGLNTGLATEIAAHSDITVLSDETLDSGLQLQIQTLAAAIGGADMIFLAPADGPFQPATDGGRKKALQTQLEAQSGQLSLPADRVDTTFLDAMTDALVEAAWKRYQTIESQGGFASAIEF